MDKRNLTLLTDFYELTMMQGYAKNDMYERVVFDIFYRRNPFHGGYAIMAGLHDVISYIKDLHFGDEDIEYLRSLHAFDEDFLSYLRNFSFSGDIYAIQEGNVIFPGEPLVKVVAPLPEAQLIETAMLTLINHQSLIATKAARVTYAAKGDTVLEFGLRRAQGPDAGLLGARAAIIGGCTGTSNVLAGKEYSLPVAGTHAHSWVMSFPDEYTAFKTYASLYPKNCFLLVDTYDTLKQGVPNAIRVFKELMDDGVIFERYGIRLDSGDLSYISKKARKQLDDAGLTDAIISASSDLDEYLVSSLKSQGAKISSWGVGTNLITANDCPSFGGVYKLAAYYDKKNERYIPKIKLSDNLEKITNPGNKKIYRIFDAESHMIHADLICLENETYDCSEDLEIFDPVSPWKTTLFTGGQYYMEELLVPIFLNGTCVYESPDVMSIQAYSKAQLARLWDESKRFENPHQVYVDLSRPLFEMKQNLLIQHGKGVV
ncbi:MAG: nicotinate phosphoribosyltransferase [Lachnospiraceae bacterium]|nr:nicotinate phosphoribosyltransferase [Lachnospiraceae bacterium]